MHETRDHGERRRRGDRTDREPERITRVVLEIGRPPGVVPDAVRFCFEICAKDTTLEDARARDPARFPGVRTARRVRRRHRARLPGRTAVRAASFELSIVSGRELRIKEVEVA